jgi:hypothetical protein
MSMVGIGAGGISSGCAAEPRERAAVPSGYRHARDVEVRAQATRYTPSDETQRALSRLAQLLDGGPPKTPVPPGHFLNIVT